MKTLSLWQELAKRADVPGESLGGLPRIILSGGVRVQIEGHRGLLEYAEDKIVVAGRGCRITVRGDKLTLEAMNGDELVISGRLWGVETE